MHPRLGLRGGESPSGCAQTSWAGMKPINPIGKLLELDLWVSLCIIY